MLRNNLLIATIVLLHAGSLRAEDSPATAWMDYLNGNWTYEISDGTKGEATWTFEASRQAMIGRFKEGDARGVEIGGWQSDTEIGMVNGYDSKGDYWQLEYKEFSKDGAHGPIHGKANGVAYSGDFKATILSDDRWEWTIEGKTVKGEDLNLSASFNRVKPKPQPTNADRLEPFEYFIGEWKAETSDGEVTDWTFGWGHEKNSIQNHIVTKNAEGDVTLSNSGFLIWDGGARRFVNACVGASGNRLDFLWEKSGDKEWKTWLRGNQTTMTITIVDDNTWSTAWDDETRTFKRQ